MNYQKRPYHKINFNEKPIFFSNIPVMPLEALCDFPSLPLPLNTLCSWPRLLLPSLEWARRLYGRDHTVILETQ